MSTHLVVQGATVDAVALERLADQLGARSIEAIQPNAFRLRGAAPASGPALARLCAAAELDFAWVPEARRIEDFGLFVTDMDSTLIAIECIDEIADMAGVKTQVAAITEAAMRGEIDFAESLTRRVAQLEGLEASALERVHTERLQLNPGAQHLMAQLRAAGLHTILVSGGFTFFTERLRDQLGFDESFANELEIVAGRLTGRVLGPIIDAQAKRCALEAAAQRFGLDKARCIAIGDGANDLAMFDAAGLSIAYCAKPVVKTRATYALDYSGLAGVLPLLGGSIP